MKMKAYVKYSWVKKGEPQVATKVLGYAQDFQEARKLFSGSDWLVKRVELPSTRNLRLCLTVEDTAPERIGIDPASEYDFGEAYPDVDVLDVPNYQMTIRYVKKGSFGEPEDIGETVLYTGQYETDLSRYMDENSDRINGRLKSHADSGLLDSPTLCLYYPTKYTDRKPRTTKKDETEEPKEAGLL